MTTAQYLDRIRFLDDVVKNKMQELKEVQELAYGISAIATDNERVDSSMSPDKITNSVIRITEKEHELDNAISKYLYEKKVITDQLESVGDSTLYYILYHRYIAREKFENISVALKYSYKQTKRLHAKALDVFESKYGINYLDVE